MKTVTQPLARAAMDEMDTISGALIHTHSFAVFLLIVIPRVLAQRYDVTALSVSTSDMTHGPDRSEYTDK